MAPREGAVATFVFHRAHRHPGGDGTLLPRLRDVGHRVAVRFPTPETDSSRCIVASSGTYDRAFDRPTMKCARVTGEG